MAPLAPLLASAMALLQLSLHVSPPTNVYGGDGVAYTLYAETFPGACWGARINAAINAAMEHGNGSATIVLPPGNLSVAESIRFWRQRKVGAVDTTGAEVVSSRNVAEVWRAIVGGDTPDLPSGLTLTGTGRTTGNPWQDCHPPGSKDGCTQFPQQGGTVLTWTGRPDNVMIDLPSPMHCTLRRLTLDGNWVPGTMGVRVRPAWEFQTNSGDYSLLEELTLQGPSPTSRPAPPSTPLQFSVEQSQRMRNCNYWLIAPTTWRGWCGAVHRTGRGR